MRFRTRIAKIGNFAPMVLTSEPAQSRKKNPSKKLLSFERQY